MFRPWRVVVVAAVLCGCQKQPPPAPPAAPAQDDIAAPAPQSFVLHSAVLKEDRVIWVRTPRGYARGHAVYPVVYQTDAPGDLNEIGAVADFFASLDRAPPVIIVGIANTDRVRDLTPSRADYKELDGSKTPYPTSGGADRFLDFIERELVPEIDRRYRTAPFRILAGHSLGGLFAIHALIARPALFGAVLATDPSLQWDDGRQVREVRERFEKGGPLQKWLFASLASEDPPPVATAMGVNFGQLRELLKSRAPPGLSWKIAHFPDEEHVSTTMVGYYAGLRFIFDGWRVPRDAEQRLLGIGLAGIEEHYARLSQRFGYPIVVEERVLNQLGYQFIGAKRFDDAIAVLKRNVELYPASANVYDSLGEALEAAGKIEAAKEQYRKAVELGTRSADLPEFKRHLEHASTAVQPARKAE